MKRAYPLPRLMVTAKQESLSGEAHELAHTDNYTHVRKHVWRSLVLLY